MTRRRIALRGLMFVALGALASGCASLRGTDPSLLNHPAMDLHARLTPERATYLSPLVSGPTQAKNGGACTTCAH